VNALGIVGVIAVSVVPLAMAVTTRQLDMLYHLGFSATWYVTSLLPRSFVLARLGALLLGWTAVRCLGLFIIELVWVSLVERRFGLTDASPWHEKARYALLLIIPSGVIVVLSSATLQRGATGLLTGAVVGLLMGAALALTTIPDRALGTLTNQLARLVWVAFFTYLASLIVIYYSVPRDSHLLPAVTLRQATPPRLLSGALIGDINGYWYVVSGTPARVELLRNDTVTQVTVSADGAGTP
jgi:hypothetical protein